MHEPSTTRHHHKFCLAVVAHAEQLSKWVIMELGANKTDEGGDGGQLDENAESRPHLRLPGPQPADSRGTRIAAWHLAPSLDFCLDDSMDR